MRLRTKFALLVSCAVVPLIFNYRHISRDSDAGLPCCACSPQHRPSRELLVVTRKRCRPCPCGDASNEASTNEPTGEEPPTADGPGIIDELMGQAAEAAEGDACAPHEQAAEELLTLDPETLFGGSTAASDALGEPCADGACADNTCADDPEYTVDDEDPEAAETCAPEYPWQVVIERTDWSDEALRKKGPFYLRFVYDTAFSPAVKEYWSRYDHDGWTAAVLRAEARRVACWKEPILFGDAVQKCDNERYTNTILFLMALKWIREKGWDLPSPHEGSGVHAGLFTLLRHMRFIDPERIAPMWKDAPMCFSHKLMDMAYKYVMRMLPQPDAAICCADRGAADAVHREGVATLPHAVFRTQSHLFAAEAFVLHETARHKTLVGEVLGPEMAGRTVAGDEDAGVPALIFGSLVTMDDTGPAYLWMPNCLYGDSVEAPAPMQPWSCVDRIAGAMLALARLPTDDGAYYEFVSPRFDINQMKSAIGPIILGTYVDHGVVLTKAIPPAPGSPMKGNSAIRMMLVMVRFAGGKDGVGWKRASAFDSSTWGAWNKGLVLQPPPYADFNDAFDGGDSQPLVRACPSRTRVHRGRHSSSLARLADSGDGGELARHACARPEVLCAAREGAPARRPSARRPVSA